MIIFQLCLLSGGLFATVLSDLWATSGKGQRQLSLQLMELLGPEYSKEDIILSPYSVFRDLLNVYAASAGETMKALDKVLGFDKFGQPSIKDVEAALYNDDKSKQNGYDLTCVESIFYDPKLKVNEDHAKLFKEALHPFKTTDRPKEINDWVSEKTKGMIKDLMPENRKDIELAFVDAAYFKSNWTHPFYQITKLPFTKGDGSDSTIEFMKEANAFKTVVLEDIGAQVISLPYQASNEEISMIVILPTKKPQKNGKNPLLELIPKLKVTKFDEITKTLFKQQAKDVDVSLPKFKAEFSIDLKKQITSLGGGDLFTKNLDLSNLFEAGVQVPGTTGVLHKAKVNVYDAGTEAGAATDIPSEGMPLSTQFNADHPFAYFIYDHKRDLIYFMGILNNVI